MSKEEIKDIELEENCECEDEMIALEDLEKEKDTLLLSILLYKKVNPFYNMFIHL